MKKVFVIFFSLSLCFLLSCKESNFRTGTQINYKDVIKTANVTCKADQLNVSSDKSISGSSKTKLAAKGNICLNGEVTSVTGDVNVLFVVDTSNSMQYADPSGWGVTCGRKKAINKVVSLLSSNSSYVKGAVVTFSTKAKVFSSWSKISSVNSNVCFQDGGTNYEAAFQQAKSMLSGKDGVNIIYFITDGAPSLTNATINGYENVWSEGQTAGKNAMSDLTSSVSNLTVNAIYLKDPKLSTYGDDAPSVSETYDYLVDLVGSSDRVKKVDNADQLVDEISNFDTTPAGTFDSKDNLRATVTVGSSTKNLEVKSLTYVSEGVYQYELEEVYLKGKRGKVMDNVFKVVGSGSDGSASVSKITIHFSQTN